MPELPEVETTRAGLEPLLVGRRVTAVSVRERRLRQPVPARLAATLDGQRLRAIERRAKYLLFRFETGTLLGHLGMSGSMRVVARGEEVRKHDHVDLDFGARRVLRYHDPRRFGLLLWQRGDAPHPLLHALGPEPLGADFDGAVLHAQARGRKIAVKPFLMDAKVVVGVGNIYASEALFRAGIRPGRAAGRLTRPDCDRLADAVRAVLGAAVARGGTTLRDFVGGDGEPGYFAQELAVYGREGAPCRTCGSAVQARVLGQRSTFWCPRCQPR